MEIRRVRALRGPNVWARVPVLEAWVELGGPDRPSDRFPGLAGRLLGWLSPSGHLPGLVEGLRQGADLGTLLAQLALELQARAGTPVGFGRSEATPEPGVRCVAVAYEYEALGRACLEAARQLCLAALDPRPFDAAAEVRRLRDLEYRLRPGASAAAILRAARARDIPAEPLDEAPSNLYRLGHGASQRRIYNAKTERTGAIPQAVSQDKELTRRLLREAGIPVPQGRPVADAEDAWEAAREFGPPVVVKPRDSDLGRGVALNLTTREQVHAAYAAARQESEDVLVEQQAPGWHHRLLVVGDRLVAAVRRDPAQVVGDGAHTVGRLVERANADPRRGEGRPLWEIRLDGGALGVLAEQGYTLESVPPAGARVLLRRNSHLRDGGTIADVTDRVHPEVASRAVEAARVVGLDVAGLDVVAEGLGRPLEGQGGVVVEVNATPWLGQHVAPLCNPPRPVGEAIIDLLFPPGQTGRIPIVAVTGVTGQTATTRLIAHVLRRAGWRVGVACADGLSIGGRRILTPDGTGPQGARAVLRNLAVEAAVLETGWSGILREGLGFDRCDVAVVTDTGGGGQPGPRGGETPEAPARALRVLVEAVAPEGTAVLKADDHQGAVLAGCCPGSVVFWARDPDHPVITTHRGAGGRAAFVRHGEVRLAEGPREASLGRPADVPLEHPSQPGLPVEDALAAGAAAWALGLPSGAVRAGLESFAGDVGDEDG